MEKRILVCFRVTDIPIKDVVKGSIIKKCDTCGEDIWASKASLIYSGAGVLMCGPCLLKMSQKKKGEAEFAKPSKGQLREIEDHERRKT